MQEESHSSENSNVMEREVTPEDRVTLKEALYKVCNDMGSGRMFTRQEFKPWILNAATQL